MALLFKENTLRFGQLGPECRHLCVDMQRLFADGTPWRTPWMNRVAPVVRRLVQHAPDRTIFTRFVPPNRPEDHAGAWRRYYERWQEITLEKIGTERIGLIPELAEFVPPALVIDKSVYSPWHNSLLDRALGQGKVESLIVSGGETDVCVLSSVLGAIDHGYRVIIATDALCSSSDETHDALLTLYESRYHEQVETAVTDVILDHWVP